MSATPFTDPDLITGPLYATAGRLTQRTGALHAAKISGADATTTIVDLAARSAPLPQWSATSAADAAPPRCSWRPRSHPRG